MADLTYVTARSVLFFKIKIVFKTEFSGKGDTDGVGAQGARKGYRKGMPVLFCSRATEKGGKCLSLGDHESIIGLLYLVQKYSY